MSKTKQKTGAKEKRATKRANETPCPDCGEARPLFWHGRRCLCEPCLERTAHDVERTPITTGALFAGALQIFRPVALPAVLVTILFSLPFAIASYLQVTNIGSEIALGLLSLVSVPTAMELGLCVLDREPPRLGAALRVGVRKLFPLYLGMAIQQLIVAVHGLLLLVPGFMKAASYAVLAPLVVSGEAGPIQALEESRRRMLGHRREAFVALALVWLPGLAAVVHMLGFGSIGAPQPELRPSWANDADAIAAIAYPLLDLPWLFVVLALHAKLRGSHRLPHRPEEDAS